MRSPSSSPTRGFGFLIADLSCLMRKEFDRRVRRLGLTRAQWMFIAYLARQPDCTQSELAEAMQVEKITISRQAARLARSGWIERRDCFADGRAYRLRPTPRAARMSERLAAMAAELREDCFRGLPPVRRTALMRDLLCVKTNLQRLDAEARSRADEKTFPCSPA